MAEQDTTGQDTAEGGVAGGDLAGQGAPDQGVAGGVAGLAATAPALAERARAGRARSSPADWDPPWCGDLDMAILRDGSWMHEGRPIRRPELVRLFASVLRREGEAYVLVTPVEKVGIRVEDLPFVAGLLEVAGEGEARRLRLTTTLGETVEAGPDHPLAFDPRPEGALAPRVRVRADRHGELWARVTRALALDLAELAEVRALDGREVLGLAAGGTFVPMMDAAEAMVSGGSAA